METTVTRTELLQEWRREETQSFAGWDFSYLAGRMVEDEPPWDYLERAASLMQQATAVIDLDTGGGERFLELHPYWPAKVAVTEEYPPNLTLVTERLAPLGVQVHCVRLTDDDPMPFADREFDLVLNRHAAFNPAEVARILARGGVFLTQQVHGLWAEDLHAAFGVTPQWPDATPEKYVPRLQAAGLTITNVETWQGALRFTDVGAIVYFLKAVPWTVPGFMVDSHAPYLYALQKRIEAGEPLLFTSRKYLIEARKG